MRSGEISADLRSARRSAISASASPAPLESKVPAGLVGLGEIGEGKRERCGGERDGEESGCVGELLARRDARSEACTRTRTRNGAAWLGLGRPTDWFRSGSLSSVWAVGKPNGQIGYGFVTWALDRKGKKSITLIFCVKVYVG